MTEFTVERLSPRPFAYLSRSCPIAEIGRVMPESFTRLGAAFAAAGASVAGPPLAHFRSFREGRVEVDVGFPYREGEGEALHAAGLTLGATASGTAMKGMHIGPYQEASRTYDAMLAEMRARSLRPAEDMWETYFSPPDTPPDEIATEVLWPAASEA